MMYWLVGDTYDDVSVGLFTICANSEGALGNAETVERYCMAVIECNDLQIEQKLGVYNTWLTQVLNRNAKEGTALCPWC